MKNDIKDKYPKTVNTFINTTGEMLKLFVKKQTDYGPTNVGMGLAQVKEDEDIQKSLLGLSVRMNDKVQRLMNLTFNQQKPNNESIEDNLLDIANYAVMALIVKKGHWGQ